MVKGLAEPTVESEELIVMLATRGMETMLCACTFGMEEDMLAAMPLAMLADMLVMEDMPAAAIAEDIPEDMADIPEDMADIPEGMVAMVVMAVAALPGAPVMPAKSEPEAEVPVVACAFALLR